MMHEIAGHAIEPDDPKENTTRPRAVELVGVRCVCWAVRLSERFGHLCQFLCDYVLEMMKNDEVEWSDQDPLQCLNALQSFPRKPEFTWLFLIIYQELKWKNNFWFLFAQNATDIWRTAVCKTFFIVNPDPRVMKERLSKLEKWIDWFSVFGEAEL